MPPRRTAKLHPRYAEPHAHSHFSFLDGTSNPAELVAEGGQRHCGIVGHVAVGTRVADDPGEQVGAARVAQFDQASGDVAPVFGPCGRKSGLLAQAARWSAPAGSPRAANILAASRPVR